MCCGNGGRRPLIRCFSAQQPTQRSSVGVSQVVTQRLDVAILEQQRLRERTETALELFRQLQRADGVDPVSIERRSGIDSPHRYLQCRGKEVLQVMNRSCLHPLRCEQRGRLLDVRDLGRSTLADRCGGFAEQAQDAGRPADHDEWLRSRIAQQSLAKRKGGRGIERLLPARCKVLLGSLLRPEMHPAG